jgi:hypothetical protein
MFHIHLTQSLKIILYNILNNVHFDSYPSSEGKCGIFHLWNPVVAKTHRILEHLRSQISDFQIRDAHPVQRFEQIRDAHPVQRFEQYLFLFIYAYIVWTIAPPCPPPPPSLPHPPHFQAEPVLLSSPILLEEKTQAIIRKT